ncbi:NAD(P)/FAD-dependent oxidoreductase [Desulforamulus ferrireducens]|uniref:Uncharacterized protein n=1 Tax=Desulforamulus ferrireducens TaxID=1833852 RepID=A0A1S6IXU4_9FIRM|nr:NAD(P)/FAD-dependent oxidoreductase [Desulforamulus ferrireducens]AQS59576.1 hypothetical protein B0537_11090 [Desulforamulus ferrireducens]
MVLTKAYDVIVVGGGPAGMLAAARAAELGARVLIIEKNDTLGRKMLITGGGRCNLTNNANLEETIANIPGNGKFVYSALHRFSGQDLRDLLKKLGLRTKVEEQGRVFPVTDRAADVLNTLLKYLQRLGVSIRYQSKVDALQIKDGCCQGVWLGEKMLAANAVVLATGGLSYPQTGSTGEGHKMAQRAGHTITPLYPAAVAITCHDPWIVQREVQGVSLPQVMITLYNEKGKLLASEIGDIIFTHWGLSGPGALRVGRVVALACAQGQGPLRGELDLFPQHTWQSLEQLIIEKAATGSKRSLKNIISTLLPERLSKVAITLSGLNPETPFDKLASDSLEVLVRLLKALPLKVTGTRPLAEATVTGGGVHIKEINPRTMASKLIHGLFFAGEIIDVDAHTGGFNMQVAFSTGYLAGEAAASLTQESS